MRRNSKGSDRVPLRALEIGSSRCIKIQETCITIFWTCSSLHKLHSAMLQNLEMTMLESLPLFLASGVGLTIIERLTRISSPSHTAI
jgi:hypothetical protein